MANCFKLICTLSVLSQTFAAKMQPEIFIYRNTCKPLDTI